MFKKKYSNKELEEVANHKIGKAYEMLSEAYDIALKLKDDFGCGSLRVLIDVLEETDVRLKENEDKNSKSNQ